MGGLGYSRFLVGLALEAVDLSQLVELAIDLLPLALFACGSVYVRSVPSLWSGGLVRGTTGVSIERVGRGMDAVQAGQVDCRLLTR